MMNLELFLILFPIDYLKEILMPKTKKLLKHPMALGEFIQWLGFCLYVGCWIGIPNRSNWWSTAEPKMSRGAPFRINKYMSRNRFEEILGFISYTYQKGVEYYDGFFHMHKMKEAWNLHMAEEFNP